MIADEGLVEPQLPPDQDDPGAWDTRRELTSWPSGSETARGRFCQHYLGFVRRAVRSHGLWPALSGGYEAEDLAQDAWCRILTKVEAQGGWLSFEYRGKGSFEAYLRSIVDKTLKDASRHDKADKRGGGLPKKPLSLEDERAGPLPLHSRETTPTEHARLSEQCEIAQGLLTPEEFEVWCWRDLEGYSSVEISAWVGKTPAAVRGILYRARDRLREQIGRE